MITGRSKQFARVMILLLAALPALSRAELSPEWISRVPLGRSLGAGPAGIHVDPDGVSLHHRHLGLVVGQRHHNGLFCARWVDSLVAHL